MSLARLVSVADEREPRSCRHYGLKYLKNKCKESDVGDGYIFGRKARSDGG
jgi:hypothetical protein